jgi:hypothetical protein
VRAKIKVLLDEELQIIRQELDGDFNEEDAIRCGAESEKYAQKLKNPQVVNVLVNSRKLGKSDARARKKMAEFSNLSQVHKVALWGTGNPFVRTIVNFLNSATGQHKIAIFKFEQEALNWLLEKDGK